MVNRQMVVAVINGVEIGIIHLEYVAMAIHVFVSSVG